MALLHMCQEKGMQIACAHVNYHHRVESDEEERYVSAYCQTHHIPLHVLNKPFSYTGNFEAAAREYRYDFFVSLIKEEGYKGVLVAHHKDDLIETYIMQKEKNIIPAYYGLKEEMMYRGVLVRRPLLSYTKQQLVDYCHQNDIQYYIDSTNASDEYTRNRIRHSQIDQMTSFMKDEIVHEIQRENAELSERRCRVKTYIRYDQVSHPQYIHLDKEDRLTLLRMFIETYEKEKYTLKHLAQIDEIICKHSDFNIPLKQMRLIVEKGMMHIIPFESEYAFVFHNIEELITIGNTNYFKVEKGEPSVYALTLTEDDFPIVIRNVKEGDEIQMRYGKKRVHRFFIDRHIPLWKRKEWPVVENQRHEIILVPGLGCDVNHYSLKPQVSVIQYYPYKTEAFTNESK